MNELIDPVAGRIPGARNRVWTETTTESGELIDLDRQRAEWRAIVKADDTVPVMYCGSGITASVNAMSWMLAGLGPVRIYAGSFSEWCAHPENPIEKGQPE